MCKITIGITIKKDIIIKTKINKIKRYEICVLTEQHVKQYAMKEYLNGKRNLPLLMQYADALQVTKKIQQYLEVLL